MSRRYREERGVCHVNRYWPDDSRAACTCGWEGYAHVLLLLSKRDARRHCMDSMCELGQPLVKQALPPR